MAHVPEDIPLEELKDQICERIDEYQRQIKIKQQELEERKRAAESLKEDLRAVNQRCVVLSLSKQCDMCRRNVFSEKFFAFPCRHAFHYSCMQRTKCRYLTMEQYQSYNVLAKSLESAVTTGASEREIQTIESELEDIIADECLICGYVLIQSITEPFISPSESVENVESWEIPALVMP